MRTSFTLLIALLLLPQVSLANAKVTVEAELENELFIGSPFTVTYTIEVDDDTTVHFPKPPFLKPPLRLLKQEEKAPQKGQGAVLETHVLTLASMRTGQYSIPDFEIPFVKNGVGGNIRGESISFTVQTRLGNELDPTFKEAAPPFPVFYRNWTLLMTLGAVLLIVMAILGTLIAIRLFGHRYRVEEAGPPPRPAHELALARLESLEHGVWREEGDYHGFFFELTELTKQYLENRYRTGATAETSTEVIEAMNALRPEGLSLDALAELMRGADLVKYARSATSESEAVSALQSCRELIEATQQSEEEFLEEQEQDKEFELDDAPMSTRVAAGLADLSLICWITVALHEGLQLSEWSGLAGPIALGSLWLLVLVKDTAQNTPGRWLMGLSIVQEDGAKVPRSRALRRNLLLSIPVIGWTAALVWAQLDPKNRRPGDRITRIGSQLESRQLVSPALLGGIGALTFFGALVFFVLRLANVLEGGGL